MQNGSNKISEHSFFELWPNLMPYLIDGHNLIPKIGLRLDSLDDESDLLDRLQEFCRLNRTKAEVFFDGAPPGQASTRKFGALTAHFVRQGSSADAAIEDRLTQLGKAARNWTVVSSDGRVRRAAQAVHARVTSSDEYAARVASTRTAQKASAKKTEVGTSAEEVEAWLAEFKNKPPGS